MVHSSHDIAMAGSSGGLGVPHKLMRPYPSDLRKARFILHDEEEVGL